MVPTELLAIQHYELLNSLLDGMEGDEGKPNVALLTGSTSSRESRIILKACASSYDLLFILTNDSFGVSFMRYLHIYPLNYLYT